MKKMNATKKLMHVRKFYEVAVMIFL